MKSYAFYASSGAITSILTAPSDAYAKMQSGVFIECDSDVSDVTHYVSGGRIKEKTSFDYRIKQQGLVLTIEGLPVNTVVIIGEHSVLADNKPTVIEFDIPGKHSISLSGSVPHLDETLEVTIGNA